MSRFDIGDDCQPNVDGYDSLMYWPPLMQYYCDSDFVNFGYWEKNATNARQAAEDLMEQLLSHIPEKRGRILDVACGKGATTRYLFNYYSVSEVTGINISLRQLGTCRENAPHCAFLAMDAAKLGFKDASFDNMICVEAAFHFQTRERFFQEALRVLKPGGRLLLSDILLTKDAEARRRFRTEENFLDGPNAYNELLLHTGFSRAEVLDATKACFHGAFWHLVQFSHEKLLAREITVETLRNFVKRAFNFVPETRYYLLAWAVK